MMMMAPRLAALALIFHAVASAVASDLNALDTDMLLHAATIDPNREQVDQILKSVKSYLGPVSAPDVAELVEKLPSIDNTLPVDAVQSLVDAVAPAAAPAANSARAALARAATSLSSSPPRESSEGEESSGSAVRATFVAAVTAVTVAAAVGYFIS